jgi:hypothetical protein
VIPLSIDRPIKETTSSCPRAAKNLEQGIIAALIAVRR